MKARLFLLTFILLTLLAIAIPARAMESPNYKLEWLMPFTGSGGSMSSGQYSIYLTIGQTVIGTESHASMTACLGFWCGAGGLYYIMLPLVTR